MRTRRWGVLETLLGGLLVLGGLARSAPPPRTLPGAAEFAEVNLVTDGLGPRFNLDSCEGCHVHPTAGGSSPALNPLVAIATAFGARNTVPPFVTLDGPIREVRFKSDGRVHALYVITGRVDAPDSACAIRQEDFTDTANLSFRIPTPLFGTGQMETIPDATILAGLSTDQAAKARLGIRGQAAQAGGRLGRFGWKAQSSDLLAFAIGAYNIEMGITSPGSPGELETDPACQYAPVPNDVTSDDVEAFAAFMRALPPPDPHTQDAKGAKVFTEVGCALCHTPSLGGVPLFSDLLLHDMGDALADGIAQGTASGRQFRTAPLWGVGARLFYLHDGRTTDLEAAILAHGSRGSEAQGVVTQFRALSRQDHDALLHFLRSL